MKKRSFRQQAKFAEKSILEKNKKRYEEFMDAEFPGYLAKKRKRREIVFSISTVLVLFVFAFMGIFVTLPPSASGDSETKKYFSENIIFETLDLAGANLRLNGVKVNLDEKYTTLIQRAYDSVSGDDLYYRFQATNEDITFETIDIEIYVNPYYEDKNSLKHEPITYLFKDVEMQYNLYVTDEDFAFTVNYKAVMEHDGWSMYIDYEQLSADEQGGFFGFLEQSIEIL